MRRLALLIGIATTVMAVVVIVLILSPDDAPAFPWRPNKSLSPTPAFAGTKAARKRLAAKRTLFSALRRQPAPPAIRPSRIAIRPSATSRRAPVAPPPPPSVRSPAERITAGFFVNWDDNSRASLEKHASQLDWVVCEWGFLAPGGDSLRFTVDPRVLFTLSHVPPETRPHVFLMVSNFVESNDSTGGGFMEKDLRRLLTRHAVRDHAIAQLVAALDRYGLAGVTIDFENVPRDLDAPMVAFARELRQRLAPTGRLVTQAVPADIDDKLLRAVADANDKIIPMLYDEHYSKGDPGPVASQSWYTERARHITSRVSADKVILGIGAYGYDWNDATPDSTTKVNFQEAMGAARDNHIPAHFDRVSLNPYLAYTEPDSTDHIVWYLDAVTIYNQVQAGVALGAGGQAIWRLGDEDPSIWRVLGRHGLVAPPGALDSIPGGYDVDFEGTGEILRITSRPAMGSRDIRVDSTTKLIAFERLATYPSPWVVQRTGPPWTSHKVALTFDDGPDGTWTRPILDTLRSRHVPATFFVIGRNAELHQRLLRRMFDEGHEIGNHTFTHPNLELAPAFVARLEIEATERLIEALLDRRARFFRPPYFGDAEPTTATMLDPIGRASEMGYVIAGLHDDSEDWDVPRMTAATIIDTVLAQRRAATRDRPANVVLLHDGGGDRRATVAALGILIDSLRARGDTLVLLSELAGIPRAEAMPTLTTGGAIVRAIEWTGFGILGALEWALYWIFFTAVILGIGRLFIVIAVAVAERRRRVPHTSAGFERAPNLPVLEPPRVERYTPSVSVIVPAYKEEKVVTSTIESLLAQDYAGELDIVVVDDGSPDETYEVARRAFGEHPRVSVYRKPNGGKASALNFGIERARGEIVVGLDADTLFAPTTVTALVALLADPRVGAVAGNAKVGNRINIVTRWQALEYITSQNLDRRAFSLLHCVTVVPGAVGAWRKSAVLAAGGFSTDTLAEDQDLTIHILRDGHRVEYADDAIGYTEAPDTLKALAKQRFRWSYGTLQCMWKHRRALLRPGSGALGFVAMPNTWLFQLIFTALSPIADLMFAWSLVSIWLTRIEHGGTYALTSMYEVLGFYAVFLVVDWLAAMIAFELERGEEQSLTWLIFLQRFAYRQVMYWVVVKSFAAAIRGHLVGWGKLERKATVVGVGVTAPR